MLKKIFVFYSTIVLCVPLMALDPCGVNLVDNILKFGKNNSEKASTAFITEEGWEELELDKVINSLDRTQTQVGAACLKNLSKPHNDISKILNQQSIIKKLSEDADCYSDLRQLLDEFNKKESRFLGLWDESDRFSDNVAQQFSTRSRTLLDELFNSHKHLKSIAALFVLWRSFSGIFRGMSIRSDAEKDYLNVKDMKNKGVLEQLYGGFVKLPIKSAINVFYDPMEAFLHWHNPEVLRYKDRKIDPKTGHPVFIPEDKWWTLGDQNQCIKESLQDATLFGDTLSNFAANNLSWVLTFGYRAFQDYLMYISMKTLYGDLKSKWNTLCDVKKRMQDLSELLMTYKKISKKTSDIFPEFNKLHQGEISCSVEIDELLEKIANLNKKYMIFNPGEFLLSFNYINEIKDQLISVFKHVGYMDAYCSMANVMAEHKNNGRSFTYAEFKDFDKPHIALKSVWFPVVAKGEPVPNDIELGVNGIQNALFTGPNGSGKSTVMKSIAVSLVLAHSWGIVSAESAVLSKFTGIRTYLNVKENFAEGLSTFMSEKYRIEDISAFVDSLSDKSFGFLIVDEPYRGTIEAESEKRVCKFGMHLAESSNVSSVIATHLKKPIDLASQTGVFANYHLDIKQLSSDVFKRTFELKKGPALWWFNDEQKRSDFVDWLSVSPV